mgnify:CR=1 FL=1
MIFFRRNLLIIFFSILITAVSFSQTIPFDSERWEISARESRVENYLGRQSLYLKGGKALIKDAEFTDGVIKFDIAFSRERGFMGAVWRVQDGSNYEEFYLRPHQSGNPDANQYTPVFNGLSGWQLYHGEGYGTPVTYDFNQWMPVKIVVSGKQAEFYIKDMETPKFIAHELKRDIKPGTIGLVASNFAPAYFSNFNYTTMEQPPVLNSSVKQPQPVAAGTIMHWQISNTLDEAVLENTSSLSTIDRTNLTWQTLKSEYTGLVNLARVQGISRGSNTAFAKVIIISETEQVKKLKFGYSDRIKAYLNEQLLYSGNNNYQSRDYRYLGTIGYFDEIYLPLKQGKNELWMAVSESFGGWGIKAMFEDMNGLQIE